MSIDKAIKRTIDYSAGYGRRLNRKELAERLIGPRIYRGEGARIRLDKAATKRSGGRLRQEAKVKLKIAQEFADQYLRENDGVLMAAVTGSVAAGQPGSGDDIDLLIVTKKNRLWWTRLVLRLTVYLKSIPHRRYGREERSNEMCFNMWLDEEALELETGRRNLRSAVDLILMKVIVDKKGCFEKFLSANGWVKKYVATGYCRRLKEASPTGYGPSVISGGSDDEWRWRVINEICFWGQYLYMKRKIKGESVGRHLALFHRRS